MREVNRVGLEGSVDVVDRLKDGDVQYGEVASGMDCGRLSAWSSYDLQKGSVPLDDWIDWCRQGVCVIIAAYGDTGETGGGTPEPGA
jgi:hypothetical protein